MWVEWNFSVKYHFQWSQTYTNVQFHILLLPPTGHILHRLGLILPRTAPLVIMSNVVIKLIK